MITEDYVSFEIAKLLKEKGFDEYTNWWWNKDGKLYNKADASYYGPFLYNSETCYNAPTYFTVVEWLEKHEIFIGVVLCTYPTLKKAIWEPKIQTYDSVFPDVCVECNSLREAYESAIKYCLENLI